MNVTIFTSLNTRQALHVLVDVVVDEKRNLFTGVPDCATCSGDDTTNAVFYAEGKSLSDVTMKELVAAATAHVESIHHQPQKNNIGGCLKSQMIQGL